jgi:hypothetical protein
VSELLGIFVVSGVVCAVFWVWVFIETYAERKRDKALGFNKEYRGFVANFGGWLVLTLILTFALWTYSR